MQDGTLKCVLMRILDKERVQALENIDAPGLCPTSFASRPANYRLYTTSAATTNNAHFAANCGVSAEAPHTTTLTPTPTLLPVTELATAVTDAVLEPGVVVRVAETTLSGTSSVQTSRIVGSGAAAKMTLAPGSTTTIAVPNGGTLETAGITLENQGTSTFQSPVKAVGATLKNANSGVMQVCAAQTCRGRPAGGEGVWVGASPVSSATQ